ncbi:MAG: hypothetical protein GX876_00070 [Bacteroidales bacterium]|nr:hypothetical protein [Bacteroidales bacterium]
MKREIGSFIELDLRSGGEYYNDEKDVARLNSARSGIYHACRLLNCTSIHIPHYLCPTVKNFLKMNGIGVSFYYLNNYFDPLDIRQEEGQALLLVNYFGIISQERLLKMASRYNNVIIDNSAGFFSMPLNGLYTVYSPRKFFGVPDGGYVVGPGADRFTGEYEQDRSSDTSLFLLKRIEYGLTATYPERMSNEARIDRSGVLRMSVLTRSLLNSIDYSLLRERRTENFHFAHKLFNGINIIDPTIFCDDDLSPMVYPLVVEDISLTDKLKRKNIFVGRLWKHVLDFVPADSFEASLSKYLIPIPIDHRYGQEDLEYISISATRLSK